jgi:glucose-1-phosphate thymidylyltransferase
MRAVVPAAGAGTRLGALAAARPKPLIEVAGLPAIVWVLDGLAGADLSEIVVVVGHLGEQIRRAVVGVVDVPVRIVEQGGARGTAAAVLAAAPLLGEEPFVYAWADVLMPPAAYRRAVEAASADQGAIVVDTTTDPSSGAAVTVVDGKVTAIVEKPPPGGRGFNASGAGVLPARAWAALASVPPSVRGEHELTDALRQLIADGVTVWAVEAGGPVFDIGTPERLAAARLAWVAGR